MKLPTLLDPQAQAEWKEAADWYEEQAQRGADFNAAVERALDHVEQWPRPSVASPAGLRQPLAYAYDACC